MCGLGIKRFIYYTYYIYELYIIYFMWQDFIKIAQWSWEIKTKAPYII
jgi:hypothetical protein